MHAVNALPCMQAMNSLKSMPENTTQARSEYRNDLRRFGATQKTLADVIGVHESTVSLWLKGEVSSPMLDKAIPAYVAGLKFSKANAA